MMFVGVRWLTYPVTSKKTGLLLIFLQPMADIDSGPIMGQDIRPLRPTILASGGNDPPRLWPHDGFPEVGPVLMRGLL